MSDQGKVSGPELVEDLKLVEFELHLARAMARVDAPEGFADRIMERSASPAEKLVVMRPRSRFVRMQAWAGGAIAAVLVLGMFGAEQLHQRREQAKANQQFDVAMQATDHALDQTRAQLQRAGLNLGE
jgi:glycogen debranching enzyme